MIQKMSHYGQDLANKDYKAIIQNAWDKLNEIIDYLNGTSQELTSKQKELFREIISAGSKVGGGFANTAKPPENTLEDVIWKYEGLKPTEVSEGYNKWVKELAEAIKSHIREKIEQCPNPFGSTTKFLRKSDVIKILE